MEIIIAIFITTIVIIFVLSIALVGVKKRIGRDLKEANDVINALDEKLSSLADELATDQHMLSFQRDQHSKEIKSLNRIIEVSEANSKADIIKITSLESDSDNDMIIIKKHIDRISALEEELVVMKKKYPQRRKYTKKIKSS